MVKLTERELQLVDLAAGGFTDKEISDRLGLALTTVRTHWIRMRRKLGASNRSQAVAEAIRRDGMTEAEPDTHGERVTRLQAGKVGYWVLHANSKRSSLDETTRQLFGLEWSEDVSSQTLLEAIWPVDRKRFEVFLYQARQSRPMIPIEFRANSGLAYGNVLRTITLSVNRCAGGDAEVLLATTLDRAILM